MAKKLKRRSLKTLKPAPEPTPPTPTVAQLGPGVPTAAETARSGAPVETVLRRR